MRVFEILNEALAQSGYIVKLSYADYPSIDDQEQDQVVDDAKEASKSLGAGVKFSIPEFGTVLIYAPSATSEGVKNFKREFKELRGFDDRLTWTVTSKKTGAGDLKAFSAARSKAAEVTRELRKSEKSDTTKLSDRRWKQTATDSGELVDDEIDFGDFDLMFSISKGDMAKIRASKIGDEIDTYSEGQGSNTFKRVR